MEIKDILTALPYSKPFLFVDELRHIDESGAEGSFTFVDTLDFYKGHFSGFPLTPGVILTECCAQIGLVCLGIYLMGGMQKTGFVLTSSNMEFLSPVYPGETVRVVSEKTYFRFNKLKCRVRMYNKAGDLICKGDLAGMITEINHG